jgi:hypothetical protein
VSVAPDQSALVLQPVARGTAQISVKVKDKALTIGRSFQFEVADREKVLTGDAGDLTSAAVQLINRSDMSVDFSLKHGDFPLFDSMESLVAYVRAMADETVGEGFARKAWRFVRDSTAHYYPVMPLQFQAAPWATLNSTGYGYCADRAATMAEIARGAGFEVRSWTLGGHIVAEILVDGRWELYDPDLEVYYHDLQGQVAGVLDLQANPSLVSNPIDPISAPGSWCYSEVIADIYGTATDNQLASDVLLPASPQEVAPLSLPPGSKLTYPGRWTDMPVTYEGIGSITEASEFDDFWYWVGIAAPLVPQELPFAKQALLELPDGWSGELKLPLFIWDVQGVGSVLIDEQAYTIGSPELVERLRYRTGVSDLIVASGTAVRVVMHVNARMFEMRLSTVVSLQGLNVWALDMGYLQLASEFTSGTLVET